MVHVDFVAGITVFRVSDEPDLRADPVPRADANLHAIEMFASFFVPFYFFDRGLHVPAQSLSLRALILGLAITAVALLL